MPCILAEMARLQFLECRHGILVLSEELNKAIKLSIGVTPIVLALDTLALPFVRQEVLSNCLNVNHATHLSLPWLQCGSQPA